MQIIPLDNIADAAAFLLVEALFGSRELECGFRPHGYIAAEEHERVDLEEELQVAHREQIDALREQAIHKLVAGHHVGDDVGIEALASRPKQLVYLRKVSL